MVAKPVHAVSLALLVPTAALLVIAACGEDSSSSSGGLDGGGCGLEVCFDGSSSKPDGTTPTPPPGDDGSAPNDAGGDADPWADADTVCSNYTTPATTSPKSVKIRNLRTSPIYLGLSLPSCEYRLGFEFRDQADAAIPASQTGRSCGDYQASCPSPPACAVNVVTKIERDGGTYDIGWPGTIFPQRYMAKSCYADAGCATGPCQQEVAAPNGDVRVVAYTGFYCDGGACFDCNAGVSGNCTVFQANGTQGTTLTVDKAYVAGQPGAVQIDFTE